MRKTPSPPRAFVPGAPLHPSAALLEWLQGTARGPGPRRRVRLPVVVRFEDSHRLSPREAFIGVADSPDSQTLWLALEDSALGISLRDRLRGRCPAQSPACAVWLEGTWGPHLGPGADSEERPGPWPFTVLGVHALLQDEPPAQPAHALIEAPAP